VSPLAPEPPTPSAAPRTRRWKRPAAVAARIAALGVLCFFVGWALLDRLRQVEWASLDIAWTLLLASLGVQVVGMVLWAWAFHGLLGRLTRPPRALTTFAAAWLSRLGKYVPGKVASVLGAVWLLRSRGVAPATVLGASVLQQALWAVLGLLAALPLTLWEPVRREMPLAWVGCLAVGAAGLACLHPRVFLAMANGLLSRVGVAPLTPGRGARLYGWAAGAMVINIGLAGTSLWLIARALFPIDIAMLPLCVAAATLSAVVGYLVLFAPAGLGVREGVMLVLLTPVVGAGPAAVVTVVSRLIQTVVELAFGGAGALMLWRRPAGDKAASEAAPDLAATAPAADDDGPSITVLVISAPRGRAAGNFHLPPQTDPRFDLVDCGAVMREMGLADAFDPSPGLSANYAAALAAGEVLALVNADAEPNADWVASIRRFFARQPQAAAVIGRTILTEGESAGRSAMACGPVVQLAVRATAYRAVDGCNILRPPEADSLGELAARLEAAGLAAARDDRIVVRTASAAGLAGAMARGVMRLAWSGRYEPFESPLLAPVSPMLVGPGDPRPPAATVIVPIKPSHRCGLLALHALGRQAMTEPYEIVVCLPEGAPLANEIAARLPHVRLCTCRPGAGPGGGRNAGLALARGEVLAFTDADCLADRRWLASMTAAVRARAGGMVRGWRQVHHVWSATERAMQLAEEGTARPLRGRPVVGTNGATMAVSRRLLETSGARFAEGTYGAEEAALLAALPPEARGVWLDPSIQVRELRYETLAGACRRMGHLGFGSGRLRRTLALRGAFLARRRWLLPLVVPIRLALTLRRLRGCGWRAAADFARLSPLMTVLLVYYALGFRAGAAQADRPAVEDKESST
jgi:glycosyltransferase 2 family protein